MKMKEIRDRVIDILDNNLAEVADLPLSVKRLGELVFPETYMYKGCAYTLILDVETSIIFHSDGRFHLTYGGETLPVTNPAFFELLGQLMADERISFEKERENAHKRAVAKGYRIWETYEEDSHDDEYEDDESEYLEQDDWESSSRVWGEDE